MHRLVSAMIVIEALHNVDFAAIGPHIVFCGRKGGAILQAMRLWHHGASHESRNARVKRFLVLCPDASGKIWSRILGGVVVYDSPQFQCAVAHFIKARIRRLGVLPIGISASTFAPCCRVNLCTVEILFPGETPLVLVGVGSLDASAIIGSAEITIDNKRFIQ